MKKLIYIAVICSLFSCDNEVGIDKSLKFPALGRGKYWVYKVSETIFDNGKTTNDEYNVREQIRDTITLNNQLMYFVDISVRDIGSFDFKKIGSKLFYETDFGFYEKEGSNTILRLKYPVYVDHEWYYNINAGENQENLAKYVKTRQQIEYGGKKENGGFQLQVRNDSTGLFKRRNYELYHPSYGLVFSELISEDYCQENAACIGKGIVINSRKVTRTLVDTN
jgi:hypothetical protein